MQTGDRLTTAVQNAKTSIQQAAQQLWSACLQEAEASLTFASGSTAASAPAPRRGRAPATTTAAERVYNFIAGKNGVAPNAIKIGGLSAAVIGSLRTQLAGKGRIEQRDGLWYAKTDAGAASPGASETHSEEAEREQKAA